MKFLVKIVYSHHKTDWLCRLFHLYEEVKRESALVKNMTRYDDPNLQTIRTGYQNGLKIKKFKVFIVDLIGASFLLCIFYLIYILKNLLT